MLILHKNTLRLRAIKSSLCINLENYIIIITDKYIDNVIINWFYSQQLDQHKLVVKLLLVQLVLVFFTFTFFLFQQIYSHSDTWWLMELNLSSFSTESIASL